MKDVPVFINGTGLVTAQGLDVVTNWNNLLAGRVLHEKGIVSLTRDITLPRVSQLAIHAARQAHGKPARGGKSLRSSNSCVAEKSPLAV